MRTRSLFAAPFVVFATLTGCAPVDDAYTFDDPTPGSTTSVQATTCGAHLAVYPVRGPHNGGYDSSVASGVYSCGPHAIDNSDYYTNAGDANHPTGHLGNDIFGVRGTPIVVAQGGRVEYVANEAIGGNNVGITDGCGWTYYYAHLDTVNRADMVVGQVVAAGTLVGTMGNTGQAAGGPVHLHFSVYPDGNYDRGIDPFPMLQTVDAHSCDGTVATGGGGTTPTPAASDDANSDLPAQRVARNADGRLELFVRGSDDALYHRYETSPNGAWSEWDSLGGSIQSGPAATANADGRLQVFAVGSGGRIYTRSQTAPNSSWGDWISLGGQNAASQPSLARNADGRLEIFVRRSDNALWHASQQSPGGAWTAWESLGGSIVGAPAAARNADGRLEVIVRGNDDSLYRRVQSAPSGAWLAWELLGGEVHSDVAIVPASDGRLALAVVGTNNQVYVRTQSAPNAGWGDWIALEMRTSSGPALGRNADGRLEVFAQGTNHALVHAYESSAFGRWTASATLDGVLTAAPSVTSRMDGRLDVFARGTDGVAYHRPQRTPNGDWAAWESLGGSLTGF